jgi:hypothetical protein
LPQAVQDWQEGDQGEHRIHGTDAQRFHRFGKTHGVFLDTLGRPFDMAQPFPVGRVVFVHCRTPAEDEVADNETVDDGDQDPHRSDGKEVEHAAVEFPGGNGALGLAGKHLLDQVKKRAPPIVQRDARLDGKGGNEEDETGYQDGPGLPAMRREAEPEKCEKPQADGVIQIEPDHVGRVEELNGSQLARPLKGRKADQPAHLVDAQIPCTHGYRAPDQDRGKEKTRCREK